MTDKKPIIRAINIKKSFGATKALKGVSFDFYEGEIFSIVGANGAGKSTFIKILCGYYEEYEGEIYIEDKLVKFSSPRDAVVEGIEVVHQSIEQGIVQNMSVAENLALEEILSSKSSIIYDKNKIKLIAKEIASKMGLEDLDMDKNIQEIPQSQKQMIIIARALAKKPKLLILDEPTSSISEKEAALLFEKLYHLRSEGVSILYISHYLQEIKKISNRVGVIRDGEFAGILYPPLEVPQIVKAMVGELETTLSSIKREVNKDKTLLELKDVVIEGVSSPISFKIYEGEIVGLIGLVGARKSEIAEALFGLRNILSGEIVLKGKKVDIKNIAHAIHQGIHMVPENRAVNAVIPEQSIKNNITLPFLDFFSKFGVIKKHFEIKAANRMIESMGIKCEGYDALIESLSGGNQQKVIVARWLLMKHNIIILDEPFQGVDIKSRKDISLYLKEHTKSSGALVMTSDIDELVDIADRVVVINSGKIVAQMSIEDIDRDKLLHLMSKDLEG